MNYCLVRCFINRDFTKLTKITVKRKPMDVKTLGSILLYIALSGFVSVRNRKTPQKRINVCLDNFFITVTVGQGFHNI